MNKCKKRGCEVLNVSLVSLGPYVAELCSDHKAELLLRVTAEAIGVPQLGVRSPRKLLPTPPQFVYAMGRRLLGPIKIGCSSRVKQRLIEIRRITGISDLEILSFAPGNLNDESLSHYVLRQHHVKGEWFRSSPEVLSFVSGLAMIAATAEGSHDEQAELLRQWLTKLPSSRGTA